MYFRVYFRFFLILIFVKKDVLLINNNKLEAYKIYAISNFWSNEAKVSKTTGTCKRLYLVKYL